MSLPTQDNVTRPESFGYDALIDYGSLDTESLYVRLAVGPGRALGFQTVDPSLGGIDSQDNPEDMRSETGRPFSRSNFTGGEGLDRAQRRGGGDDDFSRFWDSRNIDISPARGGNAEEIKLLHSASSLRGADSTNARNPLVRLGTRLYGVIDDNEAVDYTDDPTASSPSWTQIASGTVGGTGDINDLAALGNELYAARSAIRVRASGGTWSEFTDLAADRLWSVKGRIVASVAEALYEARSGGGNSVLLDTLPTGETWTDVVDAGAAILAASSDGQIYSFAEEDGSLVLRQQSQIGGENNHETPTALGFTQGLVFVGTKEDTTGGGSIGRLYRGVLVGLRLRELQTLREWGDGSSTIDRSPKRIVGTREAVYTAVEESATESHVWKYHLETGGVSRDIIVGDGQVHGIAIFDDRLFVSVDDDALYREDTTYASTGYLISPLSDFYDAGKKTWVGGRLSPGDLPTGTDAHLYYSTDPAAIEDEAHASWTLLISYDETTTDATKDTEVAITGVESRYIAAKLVLTPNGASTATPTVLAFALRAMPQVTEEDFQLPINVSDRLELPGRRPQIVQGAGDAVYDQLRSLIGSSVTVTILRPDESVKGQLMQLSTPIQEIPERGSPTTYAMLTIRGQRQ